MKTKVIKKIEPLSAIFFTLNSVKNQTLGIESPHRKDVFNTVLDTHEIDTCCPTDTGIWETGIKPKNGKWIIVTQYDNREEAENSHNEWVEELKKNPKLKLKNIITS